MLVAPGPNQRANRSLIRGTDRANEESGEEPVDKSFDLGVSEDSESAEHVVQSRASDEALITKAERAPGRDQQPLQ